MNTNFALLPGIGGVNHYVNPALVRTFLSNDNGKTTVIYFSKEHSIVLDAAPNVVFAALYGGQ